MQPPKMRKHATGQWFVRWAKKNHYLGKDKAKAEDKYRQQIEHWRSWRAHRQQQRQAISGGPTIKVRDVIREFLKAKRIERGESCHNDYEKYLNPFAGPYGRYFADQIKLRDLNDVKLDMLKQRYAPRTINHTLTAIRVMYRWAARMELVPPIDLSAAANLPVGPADPDTRPHEVCRQAILDANARVQPWLAINYLAVLRPSEVGKVIRNEGKWIEHGVSVLDRGKTDRTATMKRHCIFSNEALRWLERAEPHWRTHHAYTSFVRKSGCPLTPKVLQRSAAQTLAALGCVRDDVELLLGHSVSRIQATYYRPSWPALRVQASRISLKKSRPRR